MVCVDNTKGWRGGIILVVIPESVSLLEESTANILPVGLSVGDGGDRSTKVGTADGVTSLGDPNPSSWLDAVDNIAGCGERVPEDLGSIADSSTLEVRVAVHADEVTSSDDSLICTVDPAIAY